MTHLISVLRMDFYWGVLSLLEVGHNHFFYYELVEVGLFHQNKFEVKGLTCNSALEADVSSLLRLKLHHDWGDSGRTGELRAGQRLNSPVLHPAALPASLLSHTHYHHNPPTTSPASSGTGCIVTMSHFPHLVTTQSHHTMSHELLPSELVIHSHRWSDVPHFATLWGLSPIDWYAFRKVDRNISSRLCKSTITTYEYPDHKEQSLPLLGVMLSIRAWVEGSFEQSLNWIFSKFKSFFWLNDGSRGTTIILDRGTHFFNSKVCNITR